MAQLNSITSKDISGGSATLALVQPASGESPAIFEMLSESKIPRQRPRVQIRAKANGKRNARQLRVEVFRPTVGAGGLVPSQAVAQVIITLPDDTNDDQRAHIGNLIQSVFDDEKVKQSIIDGYIA